MNEATSVFLILFLPLLNYLLGSIPNGIIVGKLSKGIDIRQVGSGNIGATNATRILGKKLGILVGLLDILKSSILLIIIQALHNHNVGAVRQITEVQFGNYTIFFYPLYGLFAVYGHSFSVFLKLKGGKAVASGIAVVLVLEPIIGVTTFLVFLLVVLITRYVSVASTVGTSYVLVSSFLYYIFFNKTSLTRLSLDYPTEWGKNTITFSVLLFTILVISVIIFIRHSENYKRLKLVKENKI